jgi:hypothetical protein
MQKCNVKYYLEEIEREAIVPTLEAAVALALLRLLKMISENSDESPYLLKFTKSPLVQYFFRRQ